MMNKNTLWKKGSRILAMILAGSMIASLGTDVTSATNVYAAEATEKDAEEQTGEEKTAEKGSTEEKSTEEKSTEEESAEEKKSEEKSTEDQSAEKEKSEAESTEESTKEEKSEEKSKEESTEEKSAEVKDSEQQTAEEKSTEVKDSDKNTSAENTSNKEVSKDTTTNTSNAKATNGFEDDEDEGSEQDTTVLNADYDKDYATKADDAVVDDDPLASIIAVAQSQVGYTQQIKDETKDTVYTLYGNWYNNEETYSDWQSVFAAYCMSKAGLNIAQELPDDDESDTIVIPVSDNLSDWISTLDENGFYMDKETMNAEAEEYDDEEASLYAFSLYAGDIAFLDLNDDGDVDHVGIVTETDGNEYGQDITNLKVILGAYTDDNGDNADGADNNTPQVSELTLDNMDAVVASIPVKSIVANDAKTLEENSTGVNLGDKYITTVGFQKIEGKIWVDATTFTTDDQVKGSLSFANVQTSTIKENNNILYIDLPDYIDCSKFNQTYDVFDGTKKSGTYQYVKVGDHYQIVVTLTDSYVENAGNTIGGNLEFEFYWNADKMSDKGITEIEIGNWEGEITVTPVKKEDEGGSDNHYKINKSADSLRFSDDGKTAYIDYTVKLTVNDKDGVTGPITLKDILTGTGFSYVDGSLTVDSDSAEYITVKFTGDVASTELDGATAGKTIEVSKLGTATVIPKGDYKFTYTVKSTADENGTLTLPDKISNKITIPDEGDNDSTTTETTSTPINKDGKLTEGSDGSRYIKYTVTLNGAKNGYVSYLKESKTFTDTLPNEVELVKDSISVKQYNYEGKETSDSKSGNIGSVSLSNSNKTLTYNTPTGQYYYVITFTTKVKDTVEIPIDGIKITNTGNFDGKSDPAEVEVKDTVLEKTHGEDTMSTDKKTYTMTWTSTIAIKGSLAGYVYKDYGTTNADSKISLTMTDAQREAIKLKDADGNEITTGFTISKWDNCTKGTGLFQITFTDEVNGPVTIEYETTSDLSKAETADAFTWYNHAVLVKDDHEVEEKAQTSLNYYADDKMLIKKWGGGSWVNDYSKDVTLDAGETSIPWTIQVNNETDASKKLYCDLVVTDVIQKDLKFLEDTFKVVVNGSEIQNNENYVKWSYDASNRTLRIEIDKSAYSSTESGNKYSNAITISYRTQLPDSFFEGAPEKKEFSNTATLESEGGNGSSTYTQNVSRKVAGKSGTYSAQTKRLTYNVIINPDGSRLNGGDNILVTDTLATENSKDRSLLDFIKLRSLKLYEPLKTTASDGTVTIAPGAYICDLEAVNAFETYEDDKGKTHSKVDGTNLYKYTVEDNYNNNGEHTGIEFNTYLEDSHAYVIVAEYTVDFDVATDDGVKLKNKVNIHGTDDWETEDKNTSITKSTSGNTYTNKDVLRIAKRDKANYNTLLKKATFTVDMYDTSTSKWDTATYTVTTTDPDTQAETTTTESMKTLTTGDDGTVTVAGTLTYNKLYRLYETINPAGYKLDDTKFYFMIVKEADRDNVSNLLPDSLTEDPTYAKNKVKIYYVNDDTSTKRYFANIEIDRYDEVDEDSTKPGQLRVSKVWNDQSGTKITDLSGMPDIEVTLTRYAPEEYTVTFVGVSGTDKVTKPVTVAKNQVVKLPWSNNPAEGVFTTDPNTVAMNWQQENYKGSYQGVLTFSNISSDVTVNTTQDASAWWFTPAADGTADTTLKKTVYDPVTLNNSNSWTHLFEDLKRGDNVKYTITEKTVDGYKTEYTIDGSTLGAGQTFSLNNDDETGNKVVITNTEVKTSVDVKKTWVNASNPPDQIEVTLERYTTNIAPEYSGAEYQGTASISAAAYANSLNGSLWQSYSGSDIKAGTAVVWAFGYMGNSDVDETIAPKMWHGDQEVKPEIDTERKTFTYTFVLHNGDNTIKGYTVTGAATDWNIAELKYIAPTDPVKDDKYVSDTYPITKDDNWKKTIGGLPVYKVNDDGTKTYYKYKVVEKQLAGYTTEYTGQTDTGVYSGEVTITNTAIQYELPKTGGSGTLPWSVGGAALVLSAMAMEVRRRRRYML